MKHYLFVGLFICLVSCSHIMAPKEIAYDQTHLDKEYTQKDTLIESLIIPYRLTLDKTMNEVIAIATTDLVKAKPESTLGNLLADATKAEAENYFKQPIDMAIMNYGGIRVPSINKGNVSLGNVYELMPFDNYLGYVELSGSQVKLLLDKIAAGGGWPVSGVTFVIDKNEAVSITINKKPLIESNTYTVAMSDYLANGGDNLDMIPSNSFMNTNILLRDAFIHYFETQGSLSANIENRIVEK